MSNNDDRSILDREAAQEQLAALLDASSDAIFIKDLDNRILSWNRSAEAMYGYTAAEAIGQTVDLITPPEYAQEPAEISQRLRQGERIERIETVRKTKDGRQISVELFISPVYDKAGRVTGGVAIARDITASKQYQQTIQQMETHEADRTLVLATARRVALDILASQTGVEALKHIAEAARTLAHAQYAALGVARPDGQGLMEFVTVGLTAEEEARIGPRPRGAGVLGVLLRRGEPLRIESLGAHPASVGFPPNHPPMDSFLGVPIRRGDTVLGSLYLTNKEGGGQFTEEDEIAVQALGAHAAVAIHNLHMLSRQRALVSGLINAQEEERRTVAYDLHDGLTQYVMAAHAHLEAFRRAHESGKEERAAREMDQGLRYLKEAVVESRRLVNGLRTLALDDLGLAGALEQLVAEEKSRAAWDKADLIHNITEKRFDSALETIAYRVAQEALTNVRKHAEARQVRILLLEEPEPFAGRPCLRLEVRDWGKGFVPHEQTAEPGHLGLHGMIERVRLIGGTFDLQSTPGKGTTLTALFPFGVPLQGAAAEQDV